MRNLFNPDAFLWRWCSRILDMMILSVFWFFCSIPIITTGAASAALYDAAVHGIRREETGIYSRFFRTFRRELKTATLTTLLWGAALGVPLWLGHDVIGIFIQSPGPVLVAAAVFVLLLFVVLGTVSWAFPLLSRFEFSFGALNRTALQFFFARLQDSVRLAALLAASVWVCWRFVFPVFVVPCAEALLASFLIEKAFQKHMPEDSGS